MKLTPDIVVVISAILCGSIVGTLIGQQQESSGFVFTNFLLAGVGGGLAGAIAGFITWIIFRRKGKK